MEDTYLTFVDSRSNFREEKEPDEAVSIPNLFVNITIVLTS